MASCLISDKTVVDIRLRHRVAGREGGVVRCARVQCRYGPPLTVTSGSVTVILVSVTSPVFVYREGVADGFADLGKSIAVLIVERAALDDGNAGVLIKRRDGGVVFKQTVVVGDVADLLRIACVSV